MASPNHHLSCRLLCLSSPCEFPKRYGTLSWRSRRPAPPVPVHAMLKGTSVVFVLQSHMLQVGSLALCPACSMTSACGTSLALASETFTFTVVSSTCCSVGRRLGGLPGPSAAGGGWRSCEVPGHSSGGCWCPAGAAAADGGSEPAPNGRVPLSGEDVTSVTCSHLRTGFQCMCMCSAPCAHLTGCLHVSLHIHVSKAPAFSVLLARQATLPGVYGSHFLR